MASMIVHGSLRAILIFIKLKGFIKWSIINFRLVTYENSVKIKIGGMVRLLLMAHVWVMIRLPLRLWVVLRSIGYP